MTMTAPGAAMGDILRGEVLDKLPGAAGGQDVKVEIASTRRGSQPHEEGRGGDGYFW
jgi:metal-sulfur cluster biosynthetic enzyme